MADNLRRSLEPRSALPVAAPPPDAALAPDAAPDAGPALSALPVPRAGAR